MSTALVTRGDIVQGVRALSTLEAVTPRESFCELEPDEELSLPIVLRASPEIGRP